MGLNRNLGQLTEVLTESNGNVLLNPNNTVGGTNVYIGQTMATNDSWRIYGNSIALDRGEMVFELGDNASASSSNGQRFRFFYNNTSSGTEKSPFILDYNDATFDTNASFNGSVTANSFIKSGGTSSQFLKADGSVDSSTYLTSLSGAVLTTTNQNIAGIKTFTDLTDFSASGIRIGLQGWVTPNQVYNETTGNFYVNYSGAGHTIIGNSGKKVGIGTPNPQAKLSVVGGNGEVARLESSPVEAASGNGPALTFQLTQSNGQSAQLGLIKASADTNWGGILTFNTKDNNGTPNNTTSERMRIFSNGNTYIGPSASDTGARLQLEGSNDILSLRSTDAATRSTMALITNGYDWEVGARGSASNPANSFYIYNIDTSAYRFIIGSSGNVIIGKSSDDGQKLQVSGGMTIDSGGARGLRIDTNSGVQGLSLSPNSVFGIDEPGIGNGRFVINNSGQVGMGTNSPVGRMHSIGPVAISNYAETFRRVMTVHGATGAFSQVKVIFNKTDWGSVTYDIKLASAGGSYHTAGAYYSNPGFSSHLTSINSGWGISMSLTAASPTGGTQGATWTFSGATMIHPSLTVDISCGFGYQIDPNDIIIEYT